jgi:serine protease AprX
MKTVELPASVVDQLSSYSEVSYVSLEKEVKPLGGHLSHTTGADAVRSMAPIGTKYDGTGIGIAILDSGIYSAHQSFLRTGGNTSRVVVNKDFTGEARTDDPYGHGTHVASIAAGNGIVSKGKYMGIAPNADIINLRVLNSLGSGSVSGVLSALDWVMTNKATYNVRVVNMSLGMAAIDSYKNDPVCQAVRRLVDAGVVVVAAAGNNGKTAPDRKSTGRFTRPAMSLRRSRSEPAIPTAPIIVQMIRLPPTVHAARRAAT